MQIKTQICISKRGDFPNFCLDIIMSTTQSDNRPPQALLVMPCKLYIRYGN